MERLILNDLIKWKNAKHRKPLILICHLSSRQVKYLNGMQMNDYTYLCSCFSINVINL